MQNDKKLRILQIVSSSATSGAEKHVFALSERLIDRGHYVEVVCPMGGWLPKELRESGIEVHETDMKRGGWLRTLGLVARRLGVGDIDLVHSHLTRATYFGAIGGTLRRVPAIATVHVANHDQIYKRMARGRNRLIAVSNYVRGLLYGRGIRDHFVDTVYNGTDFTDIASRPIVDLHEQLGVSPDKKLVGLVGRVCREKGHLEMVEAMKLLRTEHSNSHAVFVGRIEPKFGEVLCDAIKSSGMESHISLTGLRHDVPHLLDTFTFTAMPSHQETFGIAAIEAMARGRAVVASRVGGLPEVIRHQQSGLLVDPRPDALAEAVSYLLDHDDERDRMGETGRQIVEEKFTLRRMVDQLENIYFRTALK